MTNNKQDIEDFLMELGAIAPMRSLLPVDILENHLVDINNYITDLAVYSDFSDEEKKDLIQRLKTNEQTIEEELSKRHTL